MYLKVSKTGSNIKKEGCKFQIPEICHNRDAEPRARGRSEGLGEPAWRQLRNQWPPQQTPQCRGRVRTGVGLSLTGKANATGQTISTSAVCFST